LTGIEVVSGSEIGLLDRQRDISSSSRAACLSGVSQSSRVG
jgi:hypothetical protein